MNHENPKGACEEWASQLSLLAASELDPAEQADLSEHLAHCPACATAFEREKDLLALVAAHRPEPDAALLANCRTGLEDALDREEERRGWRHWLEGVLPSGWLAPRPAWSAALLLLLGFSVGMLAPRLLRPPAPTTSSNSLTAATNEPSVNDQELRSADVAGINWVPSGGDAPPQIELQLRAQQPMSVQGTVDNENVKTVLLNVLRNNQRFDPDVRLEAVELLRARNNDPEVRSALCHAVHTDHNTAVRLKALEALNGTGPQDIVRQTLLDALVDDQNPGVRVEAINVLRDMAAQGKVISDDRMVEILRERMEKDPNTYIRLQSAAVIRDLGPRQKF